MADLPRITVITPSFNQAEFLERTILSVLNQGYPNLEYIIIDGGSTDSSVDIIHKYSEQLTWWVSEHDYGQSAAINKGLRRATGDWIAWQNSDDVFYPNCFAELVEQAELNPRAELIIGDMQIIDEQDKPIQDLRYVRPTYKSMLAEGMVLTNQAAFWRRSLHERIGYLNEALHYGFDYEWFLRVLNQTDQSRHVSSFWGGLRYHQATKTSLNQTKFDLEYSVIVEGRVPPVWLKAIYRLRRLILTLAYGHFSYVLRGIGRRLGWGG
jgi:glycosyltransferase involved in cell wall biosynthesis